MKKVLSIIIINIIFFSLFFCLIEFLSFKQSVNIFQNQFHYFDRESYFSYKSLLPNYLKDMKNFFNGEPGFGRLPDGIQYKDKPSIVVFGCSFASGYKLNYNQTFSYKLSNLLKRTVYNRAFETWGPQHMYYQTQTDYFYNQTPNADTYIYIIIDEHLQREQLERYFITFKYVYLHYNIKNDKFIIDNYRSKISNLFRALYTRRLFNRYIASKYKNNEKKELKRVNDILYRYIKASKENIEKKLGKKVNFVVIYFEKNDWVIPGKDFLTENLEKDGIQVFSIKELQTNVNLDNPTYRMNDGHPTEAVWDILTPLIAKKINLL